MSNQQQNIYSALNLYNCEPNKNLPQKISEKFITDSANPNPRCDKNGEDIIWEMQLPSILSNLVFVILSWIFRIATLALICYFFALGVDKYIHSQTMEWYKEAMVLCLAMIFIYMIWHSVDSIFTALNLKTIYATNKNLIIQKYFGKNITFSLGSFYIMHDSYISRFKLMNS